MTNFKDFGLSEATLSALEKKGYTIPSPIQEACIPLLLAKTTDVIGQAQTGTGKTAAFGIPVIENIDTASNHVQAIVLTPTRELALQVAEEITSFAGKKKIGIVTIYGGASIGKQLGELRSKPHIVVGTPGRVIDMIQRKKLVIDKLNYFILDEADEMLNMGFLDDIEEILQVTNPDKQMLFFSATMPKEILKVAKTYMQKDFEVIKVKTEQLTATNTEQIYFEVRENDKVEALTRIIDNEKEFYGIVFCRTKRECDELTNKLQSRGYRAEALHGDHEQKTRERVLHKFKKKQTLILVATDVAARGIDIDHLSHVVNYQIPQDPESYTHRIGRTGRAGNKGTAITLITPQEWRKLAFIERRTNSDISKEQLPSIKEVVENKQLHVQHHIGTVVQSDLSAYDGFAKELMSTYNTEDLVKSLLDIAFADTLNASSYRDITPVINNTDAAGVTRLFIARGRSHGIQGPRDMADYLVEEAGVKPSDIQDIKVLEDFSFVTLPFIEAEVVMDAFKRKPGRNLVSKARDNKSKGGSGGGARGRNNKKPPRQGGTRGKSNNKRR